MPVMMPPNDQLTPAELLMHRLHEQTRGGLNIAAVARFEGCLEQDALRAAVKTLQDRHWALRTVIDDRGRASYFRQLDKPPPIPLLWSEVDSLDDWPRVLLDQARSSFDVRQGPLARMRVLHHPASNTTDVMVVAHHAVSDGRSMMVLYRELARLCAGESLPATSYPGLRPPPRIPRQAGVITPLLAEVRRRLRLRPVLRQYPLTHLQQTPQAVETLRRRVWTQASTGLLRLCARREGTTVTGALAAAVILTLSDWHGLGQRSVEIRTPLDIRSLCHPPLLDEPLGCYAALLGILVPGATQQTFWQLARNVREGVGHYLQTGLWAAGWTLLGQLLSLGLMPPAQPVFCNINNMGHIEDLRTKTARLTELTYTVNQQRMVINLMLFAATIEGALNLSLRSPWHTPAEVDMLLDRICHSLEQACR